MSKYFILMLLLVTNFLNGADWSTWRGANGNGISMETDWDPNALSDVNILWKTNVKEGYSAVSEKDGLLYTMGNSGNTDHIFCLEAKTGKTKWVHTYPCDIGSYEGPRATPAVVGDKVYTFSREGHVFCLDALTGKVIWNRQLVKETKASAPRWGFSSSPIIAGNSLFLNVGKYGIALDKNTGKTIWFSQAGVGGYASPVVFTAMNNRYVAMFAKEELVLVNIENGEKWGSYPWRTRYDVNAADPIPFEGNIFITSGYGRGCALLGVSAGQLEKKWENKNMRSHFSSSVLIDGYIYGIDGNAGRPGTLKCLEWKSGKEIWAERVGFGGLIAANKKLIVLTEKGELYIINADPSGYTPISKARVLSEPKCWNAPVLSNGIIYCRNDEGDLVAVDVRKK